MSKGDLTTEKDKWKEKRDKNSGRFYYVHKETKQVSCDAPPGFEMRSFWEEIVDMKGRTYYVNLSTVPKPPTPPKFKMKPAEAKKVRSKVTTAIRGFSEIGPMISDASRTKVFVESFGKAGVKVKLGNEWERNLDQIKQNTPALLNMTKDEMNKYMSNDASYIAKMRQNGRHQSEVRSASTSVISALP